jgi:tRNA dimethylallyltransferase
VGQDESPAKTAKARAVLIAGPTASGKSALALDLAERFGGVVINADSMQVYADLAIITARPTQQEMAQVPHRLYGTVDAAEPFSVGRWMEAAGRAISETMAAGQLPILVGGTGLYFKALLEGLSDIPTVPIEVRTRIRAEAEGQSPRDLHDWLSRIDPQTAAGLRPSDPQRIIRALEVMVATGKPLAAWQMGGRSPSLLDPSQSPAVFLTVDRPLLRERIDRRFEVMMAEGALDEVRRLAERGLDPALPAMRAHGVPGLIAHLHGDCPLDEAVARGQRDTRAYAKRQETWFRHQMPGFTATDPAGAFAVLTRKIQP